MRKKKFPFLKEIDLKNSGQNCLRIIAKFYEKRFNSHKIRTISELNGIGSSLLDISLAAESIGFKSLRVNINLQKIRKAPLPCILFWNNNHYVVLYKVKNNTFYISDPSRGLLKYSKKDFLKAWIGNKYNPTTNSAGIVLLLETSPKFYKDNSNKIGEELGFGFLLKYLSKYKKFLWQLIFGLLAASLIQLIFPFLVQSVIDIGIKNQNVHFIYLVLFAQLALFLGRTAIEIIRGWILIHLSTRINVSLVSDFFIKLMKLPIAFYDTTMTGDILQRIYDHKRIQKVLTNSSLNTIFSVLNLLVFGVVLAYYDLSIFITFFIGSLFYFGWIIIFLQKRRDLDYEIFGQLSQEQSKIIELLNGMQTIKLHNAERKKRWEWEYLQGRLFKISIKNLIVEQSQNFGSSIINELKNILITLLSAKLVIDGDITLGMMLAMSYIVGQLNHPIIQIVGFINELQDAKISLERLSQIHRKKNEESSDEEKIIDLFDQMDLSIENVSFRYNDNTKFALEGITLQIPKNKITAIVGVSGSGKTTLLKLLMKFYEPTKGTITIGNYNLNNVAQKAWRHKFGVVMQEDFIFNDTIANNIAVGNEYVDKKRLRFAVDVANIRQFIEELPLSYNTVIGVEGKGMSTGQKQRLLIARVVYKNPDYLFFDEATSALDSENENIIMRKLDDFFDGKTVTIIAHRLSTVRKAHQVIVLENGKIVEIGSHLELIQRKGNYYNLVKNQLELGE